MADPLTPKQMTYLRWLLTPPEERQPALLADLADQLQMDRVTLFRWRKHPQIKAALLESARAALADDLPDIYQVLADAAKNGSIPAIRLVLEITGEFTPHTEHDHYVHERIRLVEVVRPSPAVPALLEGGEVETDD